MIRLHMLDYQIVRRTDGFLYLADPLICKVSVNGIHDSSLFTFYYIRVVCHTFRYDVVALKQIDVMIVDTNIQDII
jgi:hypothetical protein